MTRISATNQDKPQNKVLAPEPLCQEELINPPELVMGAKYHTINIINTQNTTKDYTMGLERLSGRRSRLLMRAHGTCPLLFNTFSA